ncbi:MAG TPA: MFS transporter [Blastocatellia bacterium]|nr:MFS transporter [Blastocatellia bacterium]
MKPSEPPARSEPGDAPAESPPRPTAASLFTGVSSSAIIIGFVSLFSDISGEMIYPILPLFLTETLGAPATVVGLVEGIAVGTGNAIGGFSGWISDRIGRRKPIAFFGYALTAATRPVIAAAQVWPLVLAARFAERFGKGIRNAPRDALLADSTEESYRGRAFGFERAMDSLGAVLGPLVALAVIGWARLDARSIFLISAIPATVAALLLLTVKEKRGQVAKGAGKVSLSLAGTTREYKKLLLIMTVFGLANSANSFLILRAQQLGLAEGTSASAAVSETILAYALYNLVSTLTAYPAGAASDKLGRRNLLVAGFAVYAVSYLGFGLASEAWMVWPLFALYGLFPALTEGVAKAMAVDTAGRAGRATVIGILSMVSGLTQIAASYIGGVLWDKVNAPATFYFGAALAAVAAVMLLALLPSRITTHKG